MSSSLPAAVRRLVRERAAERCEYCLLSEQDAYFPHEPDHVVAAKHGGGDGAANLALACLDCNRYKGSDIASLDPETSGLTRLFNPRLDVWASHFAIEKGRVVALTSIGRVTVLLPRINQVDRVDIRGQLAGQGRWPAEDR